MSKYVDQEYVFQLWQEYLRSRDLSDQIRYIAESSPEIKSLVLEFNDIFNASGNLAEIVLEQPEMTLKEGEVAIASLLDPDLNVPINLRIKDLYRSQWINIRKLRAEDLTHFIAMEGIVRKATEVRPKLLQGVFSCSSCGHEQEIVQESFVFSEPLECNKDDGGCGKRTGSTTFKFIPQRSRFIDSQKIEIQEIPEDLRGGDQPQRISILLEDDTCGKVAPGDKVNLTGILKAKQRKEGQVKATVFDIYLQGNYVKMDDQVFDEMNLSEEDIDRAKMLAKDPAIYKKIIRSIAPSIFRLDHIKEALMLQLFGGVNKEFPDGSKGRGDIHILLVGDPGTAKSQLLTYMARLAPRGIFTSGKSASAAGLTAAVIKDEFGEGRYTLEAGVMVLADKGLACIDELDKMTDSDRSAMHEAMEQQTVSIAKAGIQSTLQSRCSVLGAANPKQGRFRAGEGRHDQINLPPPLKSRFDLIFTMTDEPDNKKDRELARSVIRHHRIGEIRRLSLIGDKTYETMIDNEDPELNEAMPAIDPEELRKYVAYSKRICYPILTEEAMSEIIDFYVSLRERSAGPMGDSGRVALTARQLEALIRMAEASARIRLSNTVTLADAKTSIRLMETSLKDVAMTESGDFDIDGIMGSGFKSQKDKMYEIISIIRESKTKEGRITRSDLAQIAKDRNITEAELDRYLKKLQDEGAIFEPRSGEFSVL
ncbi:MAG: minichromosome maintenance protein MCM [Candidatus Thermoplasmatota archaeon]|nr:minichromosome maintenance protein MCM [Candidatus Thermoplasmatota archaeon]